MTQNDPKSRTLNERKTLLKMLTYYFQKIEFLQLSQAQFPTSSLQQLSLLAQYAINPIYSSKKNYQFYNLLSYYYWNNILDQSKITQERRLKQSIQKFDIISSQSHKIDQIKITDQTIQLSLQKSLQKNQENQEDKQIQFTEAMVKNNKKQIMVSKNYEKIKNLTNNFNQLKINFDNNLEEKIKLLQCWNAISYKIQNFKPKKQIQTINKCTSKTYLQSIKFDKNSQKDINPSQKSIKTIILGKNESTQTKKMKHILKIQSKTNFVEQKLKQQSNSSTLNKKTIQLTYLLNIISLQFFEDFSNDIQMLIFKNVDIIPILCEKLLQKIKEQHNFIEIYVKLVKKLCKRSQQNMCQIPLQKKFVKFLQQKFIQLISQEANYSQQSQNSYIYQKQIIGTCTFIGKLIRQGILPPKIFKVCFWQIIHQYVFKVKQNSQNYVTNECLISGIVLIAESMQSKQLKKIIDKQRQTNTTQEISQEAFQKMIMALVNPNDETYSYRQKQYQQLINSVSVQQYPNILNGLMQIFQSKRLKLKFLVQGWSQKIKNLQKNVKNQDNKVAQTQQIIQKKIQKQSNKQKNLIFQHFMTQIKELGDELNIKNQKTQFLIASIIKQLEINSEIMNFLNNFVINYLKQFADTSKKSIIHKRIIFFFQVLTILIKKSNSETKSIKQLTLNMITIQMFEDLMIIECDYPFLVQGLSEIIYHLMKDLQLSLIQVLQKINQNLNQDDQDLSSFYKKIQKYLSKKVQD